MVTNNIPNRTICIFLLALSMLLLELALTRIFSFISFHHFTYLVIGIAMLGFGTAGTYLTVRRSDDTTSKSNEFLPRHAWFLGLATITAVVIIPRIHFYPMDMILRQDYSNLLSLFIIVLLTAAPFFFGGTCIGYIISYAGSSINYLYFADLVGAAIGSLFAIILINNVGAIASCFATAAISMVVATLSTVYHRRRYFVSSLIVIVLTIIITRTEFLPLYVPSDKQMFRMEHLVEQVKWHVITRLDITQPIEGYFGFGGSLSPNYKKNKGEPQKVRFIYQDGSNLTGIIQPTPTPRETPSLGYYIQGAPYQVKSEAEVLVIGCGGGVDVLIALHNGARHVVGVDINPQTIELIKETYRDFAGGVYQRDDVELVVAEGRHFLSRDSQTFDVIQLSGVDTWSALTTGAYALTENFIYTAEAFDQYLAHLKKDGIVNFSRPFLFPPTETLKLVVTAFDALERLNVKDSFKHLVILAEKDKPKWQLNWAQTIVKRSPFTRAEVESLTRWTNSLGFEIIYDPYTLRKGELEALIRAPAEKRSQIVAHHPLDIRPATDNKPFFFQFYYWRDLLTDLGARGRLAQLILLVSLFQVTLLSGLFILYPLYRKSENVSQPGGRTGIFVYFASLGLGFIIVEIALLQKFMIFLGGPAYSMAITLFTILLSSGIGSFLSRNFSKRPFILLATVIPLMVITILVYAFFLDDMIAQLMYLSHFMRGLVTVLIIAPLGLLMGMPFPAGLRYVDSFRTELNPWAWGINAFATVVGSSACILISSSLGLRAALIFGSMIYLIGWIIFASSQRKFKSATV